MKKAERSKFEIYLKDPLDANFIKKKFKKLIKTISFIAGQT